MKKSITIILTLLLTGNIAFLKAEDLLPSDVYYKDNIAVNEISASSPSLRAPGDDDDLDPSNPGGSTGDGDQVNNSPIGDAVAPLLAAGIAYGAFLFYRRLRASSFR